MLYYAASPLPPARRTRFTVRREFAEGLAEHCDRVTSYVVPYLIFYDTTGYSYRFLKFISDLFPTLFRYYDDDESKNALVHGTPTLLSADSPYFLGRGRFWPSESHRTVVSAFLQIHLYRVPQRIARVTNIRAKAVSDRRRAPSGRPRGWRVSRYVYLYTLAVLCRACFSLEIRQTHFSPSKRRRTRKTSSSRRTTICAASAATHNHHECVLTAGGRIAGVMKWRRVAAVSAGRPSVRSSPGRGLSSFRVRRQNRRRKHESSSTRIYCFETAADRRTYHLSTRTRRPRVWKNRTVYIHRRGTGHVFVSGRALSPPRPRSAYDDGHCF